MRRKGEIEVDRRSFLTSIVAICFACPAVAESPTVTDVFPDPNAVPPEYMQPNYIYTNAAVFENLGVYEGTIDAIAVYADVASCDVNQYLPEGATVCESCPDTYPNSNGGSGDISQCYYTCPGKIVEHATSVTPVAATVPYDANSAPSCSYNVSCSTGYNPSGNGTANPTCVEEEPLTCGEGQYLSSDGNSCLSCPDAYPNSVAGSNSITQCYSDTKVRPWTGSQVEGTVPNGCATVTEWNSCSINACNYVAYSNASGTGDGTIKTGCSVNNENCTKTVKSVSAGVGYYVSLDAKSCTACPDTYPSSNGGTGDISQCYYTCPGKTVEHATSVTPVATTVPYDANSAPSCSYNVSCSTGYKPSGNGSANPVCNVNTVYCPAGSYLPANGTSCEVCSENHYCVGGTYEFDDVAQGIKPCTTGLVSPEGTKSAGACGKIMHVGNDVLYLTSERQTLPALAVKIDGTVYYARTTSGAKSMNGTTSKSLRTKIDGVEYSIHDNTAQGD